MGVAEQLSPLGVAALGLLAERQMHPYEMYQLLIQRRQDRVVKVRPGTLYHAVGRLAAAGLVEAAGTEREGNRPERTSYAITPAGRAALEARLKDMLAHPGQEYPAFRQAVGEAHNLPAGVVLELLEHRRGELAETLAGLELDAAQAMAAGVEQKFWVDVLYEQAMLRAELAWLDGLCADIASGALPWQLDCPTDTDHTDLTDVINP